VISVAHHMTQYQLDGFAQIATGKLTVVMVHHVKELRLKRALKAKLLK